MNKEAQSKRIAAALLASGICFYGGHVDAAAQEDQSAQREIMRSESDMRRAAEKNAPQMMLSRDHVRVSEIAVTGTLDLTPEKVLALLPELKQDEVSIKKLSMQIQTVNDTGALVFVTEFTPDGTGGYRVLVHADAQDNDHFRVGISNTGTKYTGQVRSSLTYVNNNISGAADTLGVSVVTSPGHFSDVKTGAVAYRKLLPELGGEFSVQASYGNVHIDDMQPYSGLLDMDLSGKSLALDLHYRQFLTYTSRTKNILDFGIGYRKMRSDYGFSFSGTPINYRNDYRVILASVDFSHKERRENSTFGYNVGLAANVNGDENAYANITPGSDEQFLLLRAGVNYQARSKSDWVTGVSLQGQYTGQHIISAEQIGAGGAMSVRGFDERAMSADKGVVGKIEIYTPEVEKGLRFVAFTDYAWLWNNVNNRSVGFDHDTIGSVGLGVRYTNSRSGLSLAVDYAHIIKEANKVDLSVLRQNRRPWNFSASMSF